MIEEKTRHPTRPKDIFPWQERMRENSGFTLIESLIAAAVLSIGIFGAISMVTSATLLDTRGRDLAQAGLIFEDILENMLWMQHDPDQYLNMTAPAGFVTRNRVRYAINCTLAANTPIATCTEMTCRISWNSGGRKAQSTYAYTFSPK